MKEIILNETPVRTSANFGINNIILKDFEFPSKIQEFDGLEILKGKENVSKNFNFNNSLTVLFCIDVIIYPHPLIIFLFLYNLAFFFLFHDRMLLNDLLQENDKVHEQ